jgi:hypothetical protein
MADDGLLRIQGAQEPVPDKFTSLAFIKLIGGLQTQRSPLQSIDNRYNSKFLGGKPDALIAGTNVEISNRLTLQRRPGLLPYGISNVPSQINYFDWQLATTGDIILVLDTQTGGGDNNVGQYGGVLRYSPTSSGIYINKSNLSKQTNFISVADTMYFGDGVDLFKVIGPNLLKYSNTFGAGAGTDFSVQAPWTENGIFALTGPQPATSSNPLQTGGFADPLGGTAATQIIWSTPGASSFLEQSVVPNYTPIASNTFTFSLWMRAAAAMSINLEIADQNVSIVNTQFTLTTTWTKYQVTGTMASNSNVIKVLLHTPTTLNPMVIWGAQLEVGGPATTTQLTTNLPQGVYLWGIQAPTTAPLVSDSSIVGNSWAPNHTYTSAILQLTQVANASAGNTAYTGIITGGAGNNFAGRVFTVAGFLNAANNGQFTCVSSTATTLTLNNPNGLAETDPGTATPTLAISSVAASVGTSATYSGVITGGGGNGYAGYAITFSGFTNPDNNGTFFCMASTGSILTVYNSFAIAETTTAQALIIGQAITDPNGNLEAATHTGPSGSVEPAFSETVGGTTPDGNQNVFIIQTATNSTTTASAAVVIPQNVTPGDSILAFVVVNRNGSTAATVADNNSDTFTLVDSATSGPFSLYMFLCVSAAGGATTVTATCANSGDTWIGVVETSALPTVDVVNTNTAQNVSSGANQFTTGSVQTSFQFDMLISFSCIIAGGHAASTSTVPSGFTSMVSGTNVQLSQGFGTINAAFEFLTKTTQINPQWAVTIGASGGREIGITAALESANTTTLIWTNYGPIGLTAAIGFTYYYAFVNSETGHVSNVSPLSSSTGIIAGQQVTISGVGMQNTPSGPYGQDPQVDSLEIFRNTDGGGFWYLLATIPNPGTATSPGTWTYTDTTPDADLDTAISAPIGLLNSLPPAGLVDLDYFEGRLFGSVGNFLYYNTAADNASLLNVTQNGVPSESWIPTNFIPFNAPITRIVAVGSGLIVCTTLDTWLVEGQNLLNGGFNPRKILANHGLRFYSLLSYDGSTVYMYTSDRQSLQLSSNSGSVEVGFPIGDLLETTFPSTQGYIVRHVSGSQDNALYLADGSTGWYRLNPNQQGASMSGEQTPLWSPKADFTESLGGIGAIASIETSAGVIQLLVSLPPTTTSGLPDAGPVLYRDLSIFSDNGIPYQWTATVGSILLSTPGKVAETDCVIVNMNNAGTVNGTNFTATQCSVAVLLDEISGPFESLPASVNDPPQLITSTTILSTRYYLSQGSVCPVCWHMQLKLTGAVQSGLPASTRDEILGMTVRGCLISEQV